MDYKMPPINLGDMVGVWKGWESHESDTKNKGMALGMIVSKSDRQVDINVFLPGVNVMAVRMAVRHYTDPDCTKPLVIDNGVWDYLPHDRRAKQVDQAA